MKLSPRDANGDACRECTHYEGQLISCLCCTKEVPHHTTQHHTTEPTNNTHVHNDIEQLKLPLGFTGEAGS